MKSVNWKVGIALLMALMFLLLHATSYESVAQEPTPTPRPQVAPTGAFSVTPSHGPVGTIVTIEGHFDQDITTVRFFCVYHEESAVASVVAYMPEPAQPAVVFEFQIPELLNEHQGEWPFTLPTLVGECEFQAIPWHDLLAARVAFTVTSPGLESQAALPNAGTGSRAAATDSLAVLWAGLAAFGIATLLSGYLLRRSTRP